MDDDDIPSNPVLTLEEKKEKMLKKVMETIFDNPTISRYELYSIYRHQDENREDNDITDITALYNSFCNLKQYETRFFHYRNVDAKFRDALINILINSKSFDDEIFDEHLEQLADEFPVEMKERIVTRFLDEVKHILPGLNIWIMKIAEICRDVTSYKERRRIKLLTAAIEKRQNMLKNFINGNYEKEMIPEPQNAISFRNPIINYALKYANAKIIEKLQKACKLFYYKLPYAVIEYATLKADDEIQLINRDSNFTMLGSELDKNVKNLVITNSIELSGNTNFSVFFSKIYQCSINTLSLSQIAITFDTYKVLTESGRIKKLIFDLVFVTDDNNQRVPLEDLFSLIPNAIEIDIHSCHVTPDTMLKLNLMPWKKKLHVFNLTFLDASIDFNSYIEFLKKNLASNASFNLSFNPAQRDFEKKLEEELLTWYPLPNFQGFSQEIFHENPDYDNLFLDECEEYNYGSDEE